MPARTEIARDIALFSLAFESIRRGYDLSDTMGSIVLRLPESVGLTFNFQFEKTFWRSAEAVVVLAGKESHRPARSGGSRSTFLPYIVLGGT